MCVQHVLFRHKNMFSFDMRALSCFLNSHLSCFLNSELSFQYVGSGKVRVSCFLNSQLSQGFRHPAQQQEVPPTSAAAAVGWTGSDLADDIVNN